MKRGKNKSKPMTYEQAEQRQARGVQGLDNLGEDERADELEDESVDEFAERKGISIVNPRREVNPARKKKRAQTSARRAPSGKRRKNLFGFGGGRKEISLEEARDLQQDAAKSHCRHGDYKLAQKTARMSPKKFAKSRGMAVEGVVSRAKKRAKAKASGALRSLADRLANPKRRKKNCRVKACAARGKRKKNSSVAQAAQMFQVFHGRRPTTVQEVKTRQADRKNLAGMGALMYLETKNPKIPIKFSERDQVMVACDPKGNQIYFVGGNQDLTGVLRQAEVELSKDLIDVGECQHIIYVADKDFDNFEPIQYQHEFGEETGERPRLMFNRLEKQMYLVGGAYEVKREGIVN